MEHAIIPLPDGVDVEMLAATNLDAVAKVNPEQAAILADLDVKIEILSARRSWVRTAVRVYNVDRLNLWQHHPAGFTSFKEWYRQPEIDLSQGVVSDMIRFVHFKDELAKHDIDLFAVTEEVGHSKVRQVLSLINDAVANDTVEEVVPELLGVLKASSYRDVIEMVKSGGQRVDLDPEAILTENDDDTFNIHFNNLDWDRAELLARKLGVRKWKDRQGRSIDDPFLLPPGS